MLLPLSINRYHSHIKTSCLPKIARKQQRQFLFGLDALAVRPFVSLNSNARTVGLSRTAAESKMARLLRNGQLREQLVALHLHLSGVSRDSVVNVDHSEFNGLSTLMFARQTHAGRALPVYLETMPSPVQGHRKDSPLYAAAKARYRVWKEETGLDQHGYTLHCIDRFVERLGYAPKLVFDRGFCNRRILKYLKRRKITAYVRAQGWSMVILETTSQDSLPLRQKTCIRDLAPGDYTVRFGCILRLVVGTRPASAKEPWYILTTDQTASGASILKTYYHRFEIEELFRDMKSLLRTRGTRLKKYEHLATLLWYVCLGILLLTACLEAVTKTGRRSVPASTSSSRTHPKKQLSRLRILLESFDTALRRAPYLSTLPPPVPLTAGIQGWVGIVPVG